MNYKKNIALIMAGLVVSGAVSPVIYASADSTDKQTPTTQSTIANRGSSNENTDPTLQLSPQQEQQLQQAIAQRSNTTINDEGDTVQTISDADMLDAVRQVSPEMAEELSTADGSNGLLGAAASGSTKIIWHGKARNGNVDFYLSSSMLNRVKKVAISGGISAAMTLLLAVIGGPAGGIAAWILNQALKELGTAILNANVSLFAKGRIYKIRSWHYSDWSYQ